MRQSAEFRAEVIVHELLHLKIPNHGLLFRALARAAHVGHRADHDVQISFVRMERRGGLLQNAG